MSWRDLGQIAVIVFLLAFAAWKCWQGGGVVPETPRFFVRLFVPTCAMGLTITITALIDDETASAPSPIPMLLGLLVIFCVIGALAILIVELLAWRFRPVRTTRWLAAALLLFAVILLGLPALLFLWLDPTTGSGMLNWDLLEWVAIVVATAMLWWSYLPAARPSLSKVFA